MPKTRHFRSCGPPLPSTIEFLEGGEKETGPVVRGDAFFGVSCMFDGAINLESYSEIFNARGQRYHQAMISYPEARREEFSRVLNLLALRPGLAILDAPSGGGYLGNYIDVPVKITAIETSAAFASLVTGSEDRKTLLCDDLGAIPLPDHSVDRIVSLAGLHHVRDRKRFFREVRRLLRRGGVAVIADVRRDSPVDTFLNDFVHRHNSLGHRGDFLTEGVGAELVACGLEVGFLSSFEYPWHFPHRKAMVSFCRDLFGLDLADDNTILEGIQNTVGYHIQSSGSCEMGWELLFAQVRALDGAGEVS